MQVDSRPRKRGPSGDVLSTAQQNPRDTVKRRRADISLDDRPIERNNDPLDAVDEFLMGILTHNGNTLTVQTSHVSTGSSSTNVPSTIERQSTSGNRRIRNIRPSLTRNLEDSDNASDDHPIPPTPPEGDSATPASKVEHSKIPCRYHTLPGG
jgi:hypothetical protein